MGWPTSTFTIGSGKSSPLLHTVRRNHTIRILANTEKGKRTNSLPETNIHACLYACKPINVHGYWIQPISINLVSSFKISHKISCYNLTLTFIASSGWTHCCSPGPSRCSTSLLLSGSSCSTSSSCARTASSCSTPSTPTSLSFRTTRWCSSSLCWALKLLGSS